MIATSYFGIPFYKSKIYLDPFIVNETKKIIFERWDDSHCFGSENKYVMDDSLYQPIRKQVIDHSELFFRSFLKISRKINFKITNSWIIKHIRGDYSSRHRHDNSIFSGVVYLQTNENSGKFMLESPYAFSYESVRLEYDEYNEYNSDQWFLQPKTGDIFLFPSRLVHGVTPSQTEEERYCLAFNFFATGKFADNTIGELNIK